MLDTIVRNGTVIDGTGAERRDADLGIRDGRVAVIADSGALAEPADHEIDASGKIVAPGFVDIHTHYDASVFWDRSVSPSPFHGVTTIVGGNCGFSIAPLRPETGDYLMRMLARVEGMPLDSLREGVPWDWTSFGDYLDRLEGQLAVNAGFLVGHCALRRIAMGEGTGERASAEQVAAMQELLAESLRAGGMGFSSSLARTHNDGDGLPVPSRFADRDEILALCRTVREHAGTTLEFIPTVGPFEEEHMELMSAMSLAANRPLNWNVLVAQSYGQEGWRGQLAASDYAAERGATVTALTPPQIMTIRLNFISGFVLDALPGWAEILALPIEERKRALADPEVRKKMQKGATSEAAGIFRAIAQWENMTIAETFRDENKSLEGRTIGELSEELGKTPLDAMLDLALSEDLRTSFMPRMPGDDDESWKLRGEVWSDPRTILGASDAGAHLDMIDTFMYTTDVLANGVRDRGLLTLEEVVHQLSDVPARYYGIRERGRLCEGWHADVTIFDPDRVGHGPIYTRHDLPTGAGRLYADAEGIDDVLVNGAPIVRGGEFTKTYPGTVLRSGRDTDTVEVPGGRGAEHRKN